MHILIIVSWYKTPNKPLQGVFFEEQARALLSKGLKVTVLYPEFLLQFKGKVPGLEERGQDFNDLGIPTYYFFSKSILPRSRFFNYWHFKRRVMRKVKKIIDLEGRPDIIHAHSFLNAGVVAQHVSEKLAIPFVVTEHFSGLVIDGIQEKPFFRSLLKKVYRSAKTVMFVSNALKRDMFERYELVGINSLIVPNMVDDIFFTLPDLALKSQRSTILFANSFINANKNHRLLLDAFNLMLQSNNDLFLRIGGDGDMRQSLEDYCDKLGISPHVSFLGTLSRKQVKQELDECTVFLSTSNYETFGISLVEALASGKPAVATDSGGPRDFINDWNGKLVDSQNEIAFAGSVIDVLANLKHYDPIRIRQECMTRFRSNVVSERLLSIYLKDANIVDTTTKQDILN